jgi:hypothetical protein
VSPGCELDSQSVYVESFVRKDQGMGPVLDYDHEYEYEYEYE